MNPQATAERIVDGWVKTGAIGRLDEDGYRDMFDRADDLVISGGFNIHPAELENVIAAIPRSSRSRRDAVRGRLREAGHSGDGEGAGRPLLGPSRQLQAVGQRALPRRPA